MIYTIVYNHMFEGMNLYPQHTTKTPPSIQHFENSLLKHNNHPIHPDPLTPQQYVLTSSYQYSPMPFPCQSQVIPHDTI